MNKEDRQLLKEIKSLHKEIIADYQKSLNRCIKLGGILNKQKERVGFGHYIEWVKSYLPFSERTSRNYLSLHRNKDRIKEAGVKSLREAYLLIFKYNAWTRDKHRELTKKLRREFPNSDTKYNNPRSYINKIICGDNLEVMQKMVKKGMKEKYTAVITSPNYNADFNYGKKFNDNKPYDEYLEELLKPFEYYAKLLRPGGRVIYVVGSIVKNHNRDKEGDYNYPLVADLITRVKENTEFRLFDNIIWDKGERGRNPINTQWGSYKSCSMPLCRSMHEHILVWSKKQFNLENIEGTESDITEEEFKKWSWSSWEVAPYSYPKNPHPCSYPYKLVERLLKFYTFPNDLILDPYSGAGITGQMCKKHKRRFTMIELNANYCKYAKEKLG